MNTEEILFEQGSHAIIMFHAFTSYSRDFSNLARHLRDEGYTVYAPNLSGHGVEDPDEILKYTTEDWAKDGEKALQFMRDKGYEKISAFGLSLGGIVATNLIINHPELASGGTFSSPTMLGDDTNIKPSFRHWHILKKEKMGMDKKEAAAYYDEKIAPQLDQILIDIEDFKKDHMVDYYKDIKMNFFVGQGSDDEMINANIAKQFVEALENANVTFKWYGGAGHVITIGKVGREVREDLVEFLAQD